MGTKRNAAASVWDLRAETGETECLHEGKGERYETKCDGKGILAIQALENEQTEWKTKCY